MNSGIYIILCKPTGQAYVGSSSRIKERWKDHRSQLNRGVHHSHMLQGHWGAYGESEFEHKVVEYTTDLEAREAYWMTQYELLNTSLVTANPMRNQESVDKMLATRGDSQKGVNAPAAKLGGEEEYLKIVYALGTTTYSPEDLSEYLALSPRSIRDIMKGDKHLWIQEKYPEAFAQMQAWRKDLRIFRSEGKPAPALDLPIDISFIEEIKSGRRQERSKGSIWISLRKKDEVMNFLSQEDAIEYGFKINYLLQLKAGKLLRYKGWILNKENG